MKHSLCSAAMFAAMTVAAGTFDAAVWRGETAYVEIPEALRDKVSVLSNRWTGDDITLTLLRFDEVKYDRRRRKEQGPRHGKGHGPRHLQGMEERRQGPSVHDKDRRQARGEAIQLSL